MIGSYSHRIYQKPIDLINIFSKAVGSSKIYHSLKNKMKSLSMNKSSCELTEVEGSKYLHLCVPGLLLKISL